MKEIYEQYAQAIPDLSYEEFILYKINNVPSYYSNYTGEKKAKLFINEIRRCRADAHRTTYLERYDTKSKHCSMHIHRGSGKYRRIDGKPVTQQDIDSVKEMIYGQATTSKGEVGDKFISYEWEMDSSD